MQLLSPVLAAAMVVLGFFKGDPVSVAMGVGLLAYVWFTRHARYEIFQDRLVIRYGTPRSRSVQLSDIGEVRPVKAVMGGQDLVGAKKGGGILVIRPRDAEGFTAALERARGVSPVRQIEGQDSKRSRSRNHRSRNRK